MIDSGVSLLVARCKTWVTPAVTSSTTARFSIEPVTISSRGPCRQLAVVAKRAHREALEARIGEQPADEDLADLAGRAGDQDARSARVRWAGQLSS